MRETEFTEFTCSSRGGTSPRRDRLRGSREVWFQIEFETCPRWVPAMDGRQRSTPIILKALGVDRFDHSASWPAKVRNVSRLGSQLEIDLSILYLTSDPSLTLELAVL